MKLLAVDTSSDACSVAVSSEDGQVLELHEVCPRRHSERLLPMIDALLDDYPEDALVHSHRGSVRALADRCAPPAGARGVALAASQRA